MNNIKQPTFYLHEGNGKCGVGKSELFLVLFRVSPLVSAAPDSFSSCSLCFFILFLTLVLLDLHFPFALEIS